MSEEEVLIAAAIFADATSDDGVIDMRAAIEDDESWARNRTRFRPNAAIRFFTPGDTAVEVMKLEYTGVEGLRKGWRAWLDPWDSYLITIDEAIDAGVGRVLFLVTSNARMRDTGAEVPQPAASLYFFEDGRVAGLNFYLDQDQARRDAGLT